jgi:tetratricopeptide (TPR) repeat protein
VFRFPTVSALCVFGAAAQFSGGADQTNVRGHVLSDQSLSESYVVELHPLSGGMNKPHALTNAAGDFRLSGVDSGDYWLIVTDRQGRTVYQQLQHVDKSAAPLEVRLPSVANPKPPSGSVTIASLRHKVPRQAVHEYKAAVAARKHADREAALAHLLKAVELDPQFAEAHNDIAAQYIEGKRYDNALEELDKAAALDPASTVIELNRAACLSKMGRLAEAETSARRSMQLDGGSRRSR